jgi:hypothetical protein
MGSRPTVELKKKSACYYSKDRKYSHKCKNSRASFVSSRPTILPPVLAAQRIDNVGNSSSRGIRRLFKSIVALTQRSSWRAWHDTICCQICNCLRKTHHQHGCYLHIRILPISCESHQLVQKDHTCKRDPYYLKASHTVRGTYPVRGRAQLSYIAWTVASGEKVRRMQKMPRLISQLLKKPEDWRGILCVHLAFLLRAP